MRPWRAFTAISLPLKSIQNILGSKEVLKSVIWACLGWRWHCDIFIFIYTANDHNKLVWSTNKKTCDSDKAIAYSMLAKKTTTDIIQKWLLLFVCYFIKTPNLQIIFHLSDCNNKTQTLIFVCGKAISGQTKLKQHFWTLNKKNDTKLLSGYVTINIFFFPRIKSF